MAAKNPRERLLARGVSQREICTRHCGARCCRYLSVEIPTPLGEADWDEMRWWLSHEGVSVTRDEEGWLLQVKTSCRHVAPDGACGIYGEHMGVCRKHSVEDCEFALPESFPLELHDESDLADYLEKRGLKRGARVAASIRRAAALGSARAPPLVQVTLLARSR